MAGLAITADRNSSLRTRRHIFVFTPEKMQRAEAMRCGEVPAAIPDKLHDAARAR